jgi:hypothetical protein
MRSVAVAAILVLAAISARAQSADLSLIWRGGLANAHELYEHRQLAPVLERLLGARRAAFAAATARPDPLVRHAGQIVVGTACAADCAAGGAFVVADTRRGEVLVLLAAPGRRGKDRIERFETPHFPFPSESVHAAMETWKARYARE